LTIENSFSPVRLRTSIVTGVSTYSVVQISGATSLCHAYELTLKTFLIAHELPVGKLKKDFGHDLGKLLHEANARGLSKLVKISENETSTVAAFNGYYKDKDMPLKYFSPTHKSFPSIAKLRALVIRTHKAVADVVVKKSFEQLE